MGDLWAFYKRVSIIMLQKSSARKGFCAEDWRIWRVKWYVQHAGCVVFTGLPHECIFFEKTFRVPKIAPKIITRIIAQASATIYLLHSL